MVVYPWSIASMTAFENLTVCTDQPDNIGSIASFAVNGFPVTVEKISIRGEFRDTDSTTFRKGAMTGSIIEEWKA